VDEYNESVKGKRLGFEGGVYSSDNIDLETHDEEDFSGTPEEQIVHIFRNSADRPLELHWQSPNGLVHQATLRAGEREVVNAVDGHTFVWTEIGSKEPVFDGVVVLDWRTKHKYSLTKDGKQKAVSPQYSLVRSRFEEEFAEGQHTAEAITEDDANCPEEQQWSMTFTTPTERTLDLHWVSNEGALQKVAEVDGTTSLCTFRGHVFAWTEAGSTIPLENVTIQPPQRVYEFTDTMETSNMHQPIPVKAKFKNSADRDLDVHWVSATGELVHQLTVLRRQQKNIDSFIGHKFVFTDVGSRVPLSKGYVTVTSENTTFKYSLTKDLGVRPKSPLASMVKSKFLAEFNK